MAATRSRGEGDVLLECPSGGAAHEDVGSLAAQDRNPGAVVGDRAADTEVEAGVVGADAGVNAGRKERPVDSPAVRPASVDEGPAAVTAPGRSHVRRDEQGRAVGGEFGHGAERGAIRPPCWRDISDRRRRDRAIGDPTRGRLPLEEHAAGIGRGVVAVGAAARAR